MLGPREQLAFVINGPELAAFNILEVVVSTSAIVSALRTALSRIGGQCRSARAVNVLIRLLKHLLVPHSQVVGASLTPVDVRERGLLPYLFWLFDDRLLHGLGLSARFILSEFVQVDLSLILAALLQR